METKTELFISLRSVQHAIRERKMWRFVAAMALAVAVPVGPNLRLL